MFDKQRLMRRRLRSSAAGGASLTWIQMLDLDGVGWQGRQPGRVGASRFPKPIPERKLTAGSKGAVNQAD